MNKLLLLSVLLFSGCICAELSYPEKNICIKCKKELTSYVNYGRVSEIHSSDTFKILRLQFYKVRGGQTLLFGKVLKDTGNGYKEKRLTIRDNGKVKAKYSINDLLLMKTEKIDTMTVYIVTD